MARIDQPPDVPRRNLETRIPARRPVPAGPDDPVQGPAFAKLPPGQETGRPPSVAHLPEGPEGRGWGPTPRGLADGSGGRPAPGTTQGQRPQAPALPEGSPRPPREE
eukprot:2968665-Alexandrium_andersonii.AAC.1